MKQIRPTVRVRERFASFTGALALAATLGSGIAGCSGSGGGFSGKYEADLGDGSAVLDFQGGNKVNASLVSGKDSLTHHCIYTIADDKMVITTDEPMGVPMHLVIDGGVLKDGSGMVYEKK